MEHWPKIAIIIGVILLIIILNAIFTNVNKMIIQMTVL